MAVATLTFGDRLAAEVERKRSQLVVGLDPQPDLLPVELRGDVAALLLRHRRRGRAATRSRSSRSSRSSRRSAPTAWPRSPSRASYARRAGLLVIADGKRGDIGSTARAYAAAYLEGDDPPADALTVNPYLGRESIEPYLAAARRDGAGIFCIVKTSNAGGDVQDVTLSDGRPLWHHVARARRRLGRGGRRRARSLGRRRRRRRDASARRRRGAQADAADGAAPAGRRRAGRGARRRWHAPSRAALRAPSSSPPARSTTPSARPATTIAPLRAPRPPASGARSGRCPGGSRAGRSVAAVRGARCVPRSGHARRRRHPRALRPTHHAPVAHAKIHHAKAAPRRAAALLPRPRRRHARCHRRPDEDARGAAAPAEPVGPAHGALHRAAAPPAVTRLVALWLATAFVAAAAATACPHRLRSTPRPGSSSLARARSSPARTRASRARSPRSRS